MRRFSTKLRIRSLQFLVAMVAISLCGGLALQRWSTYRAQARRHAEYEEGMLWTGRQCLDNVVEYEQRRQQFISRGDLNKALICVENAAPFAVEASHQFRQAEYHAQMKRYYESHW